MQPLTPSEFVGHRIVMRVEGRSRGGGMSNENRLREARRDPEGNWRGSEEGLLQGKFSPPRTILMATNESLRRPKTRQIS